MVALLVEQTTEKTAHALLWDVRDALRARGFEQPDLSTLLNGEDEDSTGLKAGLAALKAAEAAYAELDTQTAISQGRRAAESLLSVGAFSEAGRAWRVVAMAYGAERSIPKAQEMFGHLLNMTPDFVLGDDISPTIRRALETARTIRSQAPVSFRVESTTPSLVRIDGVPVGLTPVFATAPPGPHLISLKADGFQRAIRYLVLPAGKGAAVYVQLERSQKVVLWDQIIARLPQGAETSSQTSLRDLRSLLSADQALLLRLESKGVAANLYDLRTHQRLTSARMTGEPSPQAAVQLVGKIYEAIDIELNEPPTEIAGPPAYETWWFWPVVVLGTVTAVTVPLVLLAEEPSEGLISHPESGAVIIRF